MDLPCERPLTILIDGRELVTLMTLGASPELLVLGYLRNQRLIDDVAQLESLDVDWASSSAHVKLRAPGAQDIVASEARLPRSGCSLGTVFADVMRDATAPLPTVLPARVAAATVLRVLEVMRQHDAIHRAAGSVHSCALFCGADLWVSVEDVSRHNGVDTITGWMALHDVSGAGKILFTTGRLTGEMVMKAAHNGVPIMVSRNGVTAMGYELAMRLRMTLLGRAANRRFVCYTGTDRLDF
ncbi:MAG: FdhD protein [Gammaproteobacteria bacterium]|jgi:FdhD protein|nr:FdhD protein [Gammaproteobacteria bacterium]